MLVKQKLEQYFKETGFSRDHYKDKWFTYSFLGLPVRLPNTESRRKAIRIHDLHHVIFDFKTDIRSECQISAFEIGSATYHSSLPFAAGFFNLALMTLGFLICPVKTWNAYYRGVEYIHLYAQTEGQLQKIYESEVEQVQNSFESPFEWKPIPVYGPVINGTLGLFCGVLLIGLSMVGVVVNVVYKLVS